MTTITEKRELTPARWPLLFTYKSRVFGKGYIAAIELCGRLLAELEIEGVWLYGVNPGALAVGASNLKNANVDLHKVLTAVFADFAEVAASFSDFKAEVERFFRETDKESALEWDRLVQRLKASPTVEAPGGLPIKDAVRTKLSVWVSEQALDTVTPDDNRVPDGSAERSQLAAAA